MSKPKSVVPASSAGAWPSLPVKDRQDTYATLHMWTQIVGKIRLTLTPLENHYWNSVLYVTSRGLTTSIIPYDIRTFEIDFDFIDHRLLIQTNDGATRSLALKPRSVADFYGELMDTLKSLSLEVHIHAKPDEVAHPIPFDEDHKHASYDPEYANRVWRILSVQSDRVLSSSDPGSSENAVRCISFGGASILRLPGSRVARRPSAGSRRHYA